MRPAPSLRYLLPLLLIFTAVISLTAGQDEQEEIEKAESEAEAEIVAVEGSTENPTTAASVEPFDGELTANDCEDAPEQIKSKCCKTMFDVDDKFIRCLMLHQNKMPKEGKENTVAMAKFLSCFIDCVYKAKKFSTKDNKINMAMVRADANKLYKDPKEIDFMIAQYEFCEKDATKVWAQIKAEPSAKVLLKGACKPYYLFVFACVIDYGKVSCPYFKWNNSKEFKDECQTLKGKCEDMQ